MTQRENSRAVADRRLRPRGGRRPTDVDGLAPLVMVVGDEAAVGDAVAAVLARLKFAVTPSRTVDDALRVMTTMRPDLIVAAPGDASRIRMECPEHRGVVVVTDSMRANAELLVDEIRKALRTNAVGGAS
jgi:hypothetical protein